MVKKAPERKSKDSLGAAVGHSDDTAAIKLAASEKRQHHPAIVPADFKAKSKSRPSTNNATDDASDDCALTQIALGSLQQLA